MDTTHQCQIAIAAVPDITWKTRLRWRFFPNRWPKCPEPTKEVQWKGDVIHHDVNGVVPLSERIKLLWSGRLIVKNLIATEHPCGNIISTAEIIILPPKWMDDRS